MRTTQSATLGIDDRWERHRVAALAVEVAALLAPAVAGLAAAMAVAAVLPGGHGVGRVGWWAGVLAAAGAAMWLVDRAARRTLPLVVLLRMSLKFPDRAPSRFRVALRAGTVRHLDRELEHLHHTGIEGDPHHAAAQILALVAALARYDRRTRGHSERVRAFTDLIAEELHLPTADRERLRWSALLHDIGKLHVDVAILNKPAALDAGEWDAIRQHPHLGAVMTAPLRPWLGEWSTAIEHHHERWDGAGYPHGIAGNEIALGARIVAVADAFEVMTAPRPYRAEVMPVSVARQELLRCAGQQFDPSIVRALLAVSLPKLRWVVGPAALVVSIPLVERVAAALERARVAAWIPRLAAGALVVLGVTLAPLGRTPAPGSKADATEVGTSSTALAGPLTMVGLASPGSARSIVEAFTGASGEWFDPADTSSDSLSAFASAVEAATGSPQADDALAKAPLTAATDQSAPSAGANTTEAAAAGQGQNPDGLDGFEASGTIQAPEPERPTGSTQSPSPVSLAARDHSQDAVWKNHGAWVRSFAAAGRASSPTSG